VTRLHNFMTANRITGIRLAVRAGVSATHISRVRRGASEPTRGIMVAIAGAASDILRKKIPVSELFDLGDDE